MYFAIKSLFNPTVSSFEKVGYNTISAEGLVDGIILSIYSIVKLPAFLLKHIFIAELKENLWWLLLMFIVSLVVILALRRKDTVVDKLTVRNKSFWYLLGASAFLIAAGLYPYEVVNKSALQLYLESRHQLLLPIGIGLLLAALINVINNRVVKSTIFAISTAACIVAGWSIYAQYILDVKLQTALSNTLSAAPFSKQIVFVQTKNIDNNLQIWRHYELSNIYHKYYKGEDVLFTTAEGLEKIRRIGWSEYKTEAYRLRNFDQNTERTAYVDIDIVKNRVTLTDIINGRLEGNILKVAVH